MKIVHLNTKFLNRKPITFLEYSNRAYDALKDLTLEYKGFNEWYFQKVITGIEKGERSILIKEHNNRLVGISILKNTKTQKKICTFRIVEEFQRFGIGQQLLVNSMDILEVRHPLITVSEKRIHQFRPFLQKAGFYMFEQYPNFYIKGLKEYSFNGPIEEPISAPMNMNNRLFWPKSILNRSICEFAKSV